MQVTGGTRWLGGTVVKFLLHVRAGVVGHIQAGIKNVVTKASNSASIGNGDSEILMNGHFQVLVSFRKSQVPTHPRLIPTTIHVCLKKNNYYYN